MSVSYVGTGSTAFANGVATITPGVHASTVAGNLMLAFYLHKPENLPMPAAPTGWTYLGSQAGGTGTFGTDTGPTAVGIYYRIATSGSETVTFDAVAGASVNDSGGAFVNTYSRSLTGWVTPTYTGGADASMDTSWSITGATNLSITTGDVLVSCHYGNSDTAGFTAITTVATGATLGTQTSRVNNTIGSGNDSCVRCYDMPVSSGTSSAAPSATATLTSALSGVGVFVRLRDQSASNVAPTASAGSDQTVASGATVSLVGTDADSDGSVASRQWTQITTGAPTVTLTGATTANASFSSAAQGVYQFKYVVTDDLGAVSTDSFVNVYVTSSAPLPFAVYGSTNWTGAASDLTDSSDSTYAESPTAPVTEAVTYRMTPCASGNVSFTLRHGTALGSPTVTRSYELVQGSTFSSVVATRSGLTLPSSPTDYTFVLTSGEATAFNNRNVYGIRVTDNGG